MIKDGDVPPTKDDAPTVGGCFREWSARADIDGGRALLKSFGDDLPPREGDEVTERPIGRTRNDLPPEILPLA